MDATQVPPAATVRGRLPHGVRLVELPACAHERGSLSEVYRASWPETPEALQWNVVTSPADVMRGMHVHLRYHEWYVLLSGRTVIGYRDVRRGSPTEGASAMIELTGPAGCAVAAPPGVAHGILTLAPSVLLVGISREWDGSGELGCHWQDPGLGLTWPRRDVVLSERDAQWPGLDALVREVPAWTPS